MSTGLPQYSFTQGEVSPNLYGRVDFEGYYKGLKTCRNFIVQKYGGVTNRPGTRFICETHDSTVNTRLIPFQFSNQQTYILEFGDKTMRIIYRSALVTSGGNPVVVTTPWSHTDLAELKYTQSADVLTVCHPDYPIHQISRTSQTVWTCTDFTNVKGPFQEINVDKTKTVTVSAVTGNITVTANADIFTADMVGTLFYIQQTFDDTTPVWEVSKTISTNDKVRYESNYYNAVAGGTTGTLAPTTIEGQEKDGTSGVLWEYLHSGFGVVAITGFTSTKVVTGTVQSRMPELNVTTATYNWAYGAFGGNQDYPSATAYYQQRQVFGGTNGQPQSLWFSTVKGFTDFGKSRPILDDDAITVDIFSNTVNTIKHMVELSKLIVFTTGGPFVVNGGNDGGGIITPGTVNVKNQGANPCGDVPPIKINNYALFVQEKGNQVRTLGYSFAEDSFMGQDITVMSNHLLKANTIKEWCYQELPESVIWSIRDDGVLLGMTFLPEQQVTAWHRHDTDGTFESIASISEDSEDAVYLVCNRTIGGETKRYIERLANRLFSNTEDAFFVDSGLTYNGVKTDTFSGLDHLEGKTVSVLADGFVQDSKVVSGGSVTIDYAAEVVHIGLPIIADLETLNLSVKGQNILDKQKIVNAVSVYAVESGVVSAGADVDHLIEFKSASKQYYDAPDSVMTGIQDIRIPATWSKSAQIFIRQSNPLPLTILSIIPEIEVAGY